MLPDLAWAWGRGEEEGEGRERRVLSLSPPSFILMQSCMAFAPICVIHTAVLALSRVRDFLPEMRRADTELKTLLSDSSDDQSRQRLDIENHEEGEPFIEFVRQSVFYQKVSLFHFSTLSCRT